jgi:hypothetical protein
MPKIHRGMQARGLTGIDREESQLAPISASSPGLQMKNQGSKG